MAPDEGLPTFKHTPLKPGAIRVLSPIHEAEGHDWILDTASLDAEDLGFDALSYTWGPQNETYLTSCNGNSMHVHHNVYSALPFLARRTGELSTQPIWVDAVCINQEDEDEKRFQIQLMNTLYRRARQVWVWLVCGTPQEQAQMSTAIAMLPHIVDEARQRRSLPKTWGSSEVGPKLRHLHPDAWRAITYLLRNPWYNRTWIVQEAALAEDVIFLCGPHKIERRMIEAAVKSDKWTSWKATDANGDPVKLESTPINGSTAFHIRRLFRGESTTKPLSKADFMLRVMISLTEEHTCFLPQDRAIGDHISSDSLRRFTKYLLLQNDPLKTLSWWRFFNMAFGLEKMNGLLSWVPDFHRQAKGTSQLCLIRQIDKIRHIGSKDQRYQASRTPNTVQAGPLPATLVLQGTILDEVIFLHPVIPKTSDNPQDNGNAQLAWFAQLSRWEEDIAEKVMHTGDSESEGYLISDVSLRRLSEDKYWQTLLANHYIEGITGYVITKEACRQYRGTMRQVRTLYEWQLEQLERYAQAHCGCYEAVC